MTDKERLEKALGRITEAKTLVRDVNDGLEVENSQLQSCVYNLDVQRKNLEDLLQFMELAA